MTRPLARLASVVLVAIGVARAVGSAAPPPLADRIWFCPGPGTLDFIRLFERSEEWAHTRQLVDVFKRT